MTRQLENKTHPESNRFESGRRWFLQTAAVGTGLGATGIPASGSVGATTAVAQDADEQWPMVGYDAANTGYSPDGTGPTNLEEVWSFETGFDIQSSPVVSEGTAYIGSEDRQFYAIDIETGELDWKFGVEEPIESAGAILRDSIFVPTRSDKIYALDKNTGEEIWSKDVRHIRTGITAASGKVIYTVANHLIARDASDGEQIWEVSAYHSGYSGPASANGSVYFGTTEGKLYSIDGETGSEEWTFRAFDWITSTPTVAHNTVYVGSNDEHIYAIDTENGDQIWNYELGGPVRTSPVVTDDVVYVTDGGTLVALDNEEGTEIWTNSLSGYSRASPAIAGEKIYVSSENTLQVFDKTDGEELSSFETEDRINASPAISSRMAFVGSTDNSLYALSDDTSDDPADFSVEILSPKDGEEVTEGEAFDVEVEVTNTKEKKTQKTIELTTPIKENTDLELAGGNTETVTFEIPSEVVYGDIGITVESPDDTDQVTVLAADPCFIATAAYDTPTAEEIDVLRNFRDDVLRRNAIGRLMIKTYYWGSPPIARWIRRNSTRRELVKQYFVEPLVSTVERYSNKWHRE